MRTYQVDTSNFEVHAPRHIFTSDLFTLNKHLQTHLYEYAEDKRTTRKRREEFVGIVKSTEDINERTYR